MMTMPSMIYPYGADLVALNSNFKRVGNNVAQCNGLWDCYEKSCNMSHISDVMYVATREHYENATCSLSYNSVINETYHWPLLNVARQLLVVSILTEIVSAALLGIRFLWEHFEIAPRDFMILGWNILFCCTFIGPTLCLLVIQVLVSIFYDNLVKIKGHDLPSWIFNWLLVPGILLLVSLFVSCGHVLLVLYPLRERGYESLA